MRDNHDGYPEIVNAYERGGQYFGAVRLILKDGSPTLEFGVTEAGYIAIKRILSARPFDTLPGIQYKYFFTGSFIGADKPEQDVFKFHIRIEQGATAKKFQFNGPKTLLANLLWFFELKSVDQTGGLNILSHT
jgi:hypothetical protein